jgi:hypothetical protein
MKIFCLDTNKWMNLNSLEQDYKVQRGLRSHLTRNKVNIDQLLIDKNININVCRFCGNIVPYRLTYQITNNQIEVVGILPGLSHLCKAPYYCGDKMCSGKHLNRNSVEFVTTAYGLSISDAHTFILDRNSTPLYATNHTTKQDHLDYQRHQQLKVSKKGVILGSYKRSLDGYISQYGLDEGTILYNEYNQKKKHTKQTYIDRYGKEVGFFKWIQSKNTRSNIIINCKRDLFLLVKQTLNDCSKDALLTTPPELLICQIHGYPILKRFMDFDTILEDIINEVLNQYPLLNIFDPTLEKRTSYGYFSWTDNKRLLRSKHERKVYTMLINSGMIEEQDFVVDGNYPNSKQRYDFYIISLNLYIEIAGMMNEKQYKNKMNNKQNMFNSNIIEPQHIDVQITEIINEFKSTSVRTS